MRPGPLFVTRKFPPSIGGMETLADGVWRSLLLSRPDARLIAMGRSNVNLLWWIPVALVRMTWLLARRRPCVVLTGDALMYALARPLLVLFRVPHATMIMGLDVTFEHRLYRAVVHRALRAAPQVLAISTATAEQAIRFGVPAARVSVIRLGVRAPQTGPAERRAAGGRLRAQLHLGEDDVLLLTLGRLVRRKGARWFVAEVMPRLPAHLHYLVAGEGPEGDAVAQAAEAAGVTDRVHLLGRVDDAERETLMAGADLFVQPNVAVPGDMEGFGLVVVEAAMRGTPVVAADLEGIRDAVIGGETGELLPSADAEAWSAAIRRLTAEPVALVALGRQQGLAAAGAYGEEAMGRAICAALSIEPGRD